MDVRKSIIKTTKFMLALIAGLFLLFILILFNPIAMISNNFKLTQLKNGVLENKYANSTLLLDNAHMGLLSGNSNHCDFFVQAVYGTNDDFSQIQNHYNKIEFTPVSKEADPVSKEIISVIPKVADINTGRSLSYFYEIDSKINKMSDTDFKTLNKNNYKTVYVVHVYDSFFEGYGMNDIRCH